MTDGLLISSSIRSRLDDSTLSRLQAALHPVDCQTCGERCGPADELALTVDDSGVGVIMASLHHSDCRKSEWRKLPATTQQLNFHVTWRTRALMWDAAGTPLVLVNPSCELATLRSVGTWRRRWQFTTLNGFINQGFTRAVDPSSLNRLPQRLRADLSPAQLRVQVQNGSQASAWTTEISEEMYSKALELKQVIIGITSMVDPKVDDLTEAKLTEMIRKGDIACACATAVDTPESRKPGKDAKGRTDAVEAMAKRRMRVSDGGAVNSRRADGDLIVELSIATEMLGDVEYDIHPEFARTLTEPLRKLKKDDLILALGMYILQNAARCWTHVMLPDPGTASHYEYSLQKFCKGYFPVTRAPVDCTPARGKVTIGTYQEFESVGRRLERDLSAASGFKVLGIAIDPGPGFAPGAVPLGFTRYCTRLIEV